MIKAFTRFSILSLSFIAVACGAANSEASNTVSTADSSQKSNPVVSLDSIPIERSSINKEPIASFSKRTDDPLNEFYFSVKLFETKYTQRYVMKMTYETLQVSDTITIPYLNIWPQPKIEKGSSGLECIVGFVDQKQVFRPYKRVFVENEKLKVKTLHFYRVRGWKKELY